MSSLEALARLIERHAPGEGVIATALPRVKVARSTRPISKTHGMHAASVCLIAQGRKRVTLGDEEYTYDSSQYLVASVDVPVTGQVLDATPERPYLCFILELDPHELASLVLQTGPASAPPADAPRRGVFVATVDEPLREAVVRLLTLLDSPRDVAALGPLAEREVLYR